MEVHAHCKCSFLCTQHISEDTKTCPVCKYDVSKDEQYKSNIKNVVSIKQEDKIVQQNNEKAYIELMERRKNRKFMCPVCFCEERVILSEDIHNLGIDDLDGCYCCKECLKDFVSSYFREKNHDIGAVPCPNSAKCKQKGDKVYLN